MKKVIGETSPHLEIIRRSDICRTWQQLEKIFRGGVEMFLTDPIFGHASGRRLLGALHFQVGRG